jgi:hypothetical protein
MSKQISLQYCPQCGTPFAGNIVCHQCGFDQTKTSSAVPQPEKSDEVTPSRKVSKVIYWLGSNAWILTTFITLIFFIVGLFRLFSGGLWFVISSLLAFGLGFYVLKPFSDQVKHEQYYYILNDVWMLGGLRFPKIIPLSVILAIFLQGYGALLFLIPVIVIVFFGPVKSQGKISTGKNTLPKTEILTEENATT